MRLFISIPQASRIPSQLETFLKRLLSIPLDPARLILAKHQQTTMEAFAILSPSRQRISQDIYNLQAEIGRDAARAYCACQLESCANFCSISELSNLLVKLE